MQFCSDADGPALWLVAELLILIRITKLILQSVIIIPAG